MGGDSDNTCRRQFSSPPAWLRGPALPPVAVGPCRSRGKAHRHSTVMWWAACRSARGFPPYQRPCPVPGIRDAPMSPNRVRAHGGRQAGKSWVAVVKRSPRRRADGTPHRKLVAHGTASRTAKTRPQVSGKGMPQLKSCNVAHPRHRRWPNRAMSTQVSAPQITPGRARRRAGRRWRPGRGSRRSLRAATLVTQGREAIVAHGQGGNSRQRGKGRR